MRLFYIIWASSDYPVENVSPALHGDALEHSEHGKQKIVKVGYAVVGSLPSLSARCTIEQAKAAVPWNRTRRGLFFCEGAWGAQSQTDEPTNPKHQNKKTKTFV